MCRHSESLLLEASSGVKQAESQLVKKLLYSGTVKVLGFTWAALCRSTPPENVLEAGQGRRWLVRHPGAVDNFGQCADRQVLASAEGSVTKKLRDYRMHNRDSAIASLPRSS